MGRALAGVRSFNFLIVRALPHGGVGAVWVLAVQDLDPEVAIKQRIIMPIERITTLLSVT